jgi:hypothetical protein
LRGSSVQKQASTHKTESSNDVVVSSDKLAVNPRPLGELLDAACGVLRRYVVFQWPEQPAVISLWILHTWAFGAFDYTPYLSVWAASKRAGKSRVLEVLEFLVKNPIKTESGTSAALIRSIDEKNLPTFLLDEVDKLYANKKNSDGEADSTCRFLNAGYRRGAKFLRCVGQGAAIESKEFPAFCPKATAGIGRCLPDTVADRSIPIELARQTREERAERLRDREARTALAPLKTELEAWAKQPEVIATLRDARPVMPDELHDRAQDITEPLLAIADMAGGEWPARARAALIKLYAGEEDADIGVRLLADIKRVFDEKGAERLFTDTIIKELIANADDAPWALWFEDALKHDKIDSAASKLAKRLKAYHIKPSRFRIGEENKKGYQSAQFERAWKQYLTTFQSPLQESGTTGTRGTNPQFTYENSCSPFNDSRVNVHPSGKIGGTEDYEGKKANVHPVHAVHPNQDGLQTGLETPANLHGKPGHKCLTCTNWRWHLCEACERRWGEGAWVYPGDWLKHSPKDPLPGWAEVNSDAQCELCGERVGRGGHWFIQRTDPQRVRCSDCQSVIWQIEGRAIIWPGGCAVPGYTKDDRADYFKQPDLKHDATRYMESIIEVAGEQYVPKRIRELLAAGKTGMTEGEFLAEATRLFNATPARD